MTYRKDIDGLRAVAVLAVIAFHLRIGLVPGGFVGVDVFFVISGYLIGGMILAEAAAGRLSLVSFYERRVRRILPALFALLPAVSVAAYLYMVPSELADYGWSVLATTLSFSNFYFWLQSGYFSAPALSVPLNHTWSLAIEEQFYLCLPLLVLLLHRAGPRTVRPALVAVTLLSLAIGAIDTHADRIWAFYMPQGRAWELLLGTLVAAGPPIALRSALLRNGAAAAGLLLILYAALRYSAMTAFPGLAALVPCLGTALLLAAGQSGGTVTGGLLSWRPLGFLGRISYSLYLWHWPIIVFLTFAGFLPPLGPISARQALLAAALSLAAATLSWRFVEQPFRYGARRPSRAVLFKMAGGAAAALAALGLGLSLTHGLLFWFPPRAAALAAYLDYHRQEGSDSPMAACSTMGDRFDPQRLAASPCLAEDKTRRNYLLLGDSHAAHLWYGLSKAFPEVNFLLVSGDGCRPLLDPAQAATPACARLMAYLFDDYLPRHHIDGMIIAANWHEDDVNILGPAIKWDLAHEIRPILVGPIPRYDTALPRLLALSVRDGDPALVDRHRLDRSHLDGELRRLAAQTGADYISLVETLCDPAPCVIYAAPDVPLQFDFSHLTREGSLLLAERLRSRGLLR